MLLGVVFILVDLIIVMIFTKRIKNYNGILNESALNQFKSKIESTCLMCGNLFCFELRIDFFFNLNFLLFGSLKSK